MDSLPDESSPAALRFLSAHTSSLDALVGPHLGAPELRLSRRANLAGAESPHHPPERPAALLRWLSHRAAFRSALWLAFADGIHPWRGGPGQRTARRPRRGNWRLHPQGLQAH